jgi:UPF0755 protein
VNSSLNNDPLSTAPDISAKQFGRAGDKFAQSSEPASASDDDGKKSRRSGSARGKTVVLFNLLFSSVVLAIVLAGIGLYLGKQSFDASGPLKADATVLIAKGAGLNTIIDILERNRVIDRPLLFKLGVQAYKEQKNLKAGEYAFSKDVSMHEVMKILASGKAILHAFTAPEGLTSIQIFSRMAKNEVLTGDMPALPAEGAMLPETYSFQRGDSREQVVKQMLSDQKKALSKIWEMRAPDLPISTPEELVTLASIVEKETGVAHERPLVASVFINRLNKGMKLQSDPTIIYGIFGGEGKPKGRPIYRSDIDKPTLYNTYTIPALPPGPIASPGKAAMEAVAHPAKSDFLYFVADGTGGHVFAKTLQEHEANVVKWRQIEKQRAADAAKAAKAAKTENKTPDAPKE